LQPLEPPQKGEAINLILRDYYVKKCVNKKKKVALVAVTHKLPNYIFAVLRDEKPFELRSPEDYQTWRIARLNILA
jgi:transposase